MNYKDTVVTSRIFLTALNSYEKIDYLFILKNHV
jgi:hypothetical protein